MKTTLIIVLLICFMGCNPSEKTILLPHIKDSKLNDITDVSPVYIFFNTAKKDSVELNKNNLISTTNWLFNIDKRHQLIKIIPTIIELQEKRRDAKLHKNEKAGNYYTCNDLQKQTLGFIDFTDVFYEFISANTYIKKLSLENDQTDNIIIEFKTEGETNVYFPSKHQLKFKGELIEILNSDVFKNNNPDTIYLAYDSRLSFQEYITYKRKVEKLADTDVNIAHTEFILN